MIARLCRWLALLLLAVTITMPAMAAVYVERSPGEVPPERKARVAAPAPVQLLIAFQTDGKDNPRAAKYVKPIITKAIEASGLFSAVGEATTTEGATLFVTMNNIVQKGAAGKGFLTGLTLGLAGTVVRDGYVTTLEYVPARGAAPVTKAIEHGIYLKIGAKSAPENVDKVKGIAEAIEIVIRQSLDHGLAAIFPPPAPTPLPAPAEVPAAPAPPPVAPQAAPMR